MYKQQSTNSDNIVEVINGCKNHETLYKTKLYETYYYIVLNVCKQYTDTLPEAEDLTQDIFLKIFDKIGTFDGNSIGKFTNWIKRVSKNTALDLYNKRKIKTTNIDDYFDLVTDTFDGTNDEKYDDIMFKRLDIAISKLTVNYREIVTLFYMNNYSHEQIANKLNINIGTSKSNLFKAKKKLLKMLTHYNNRFN